jgi:molybdate/tungstate transport system substrate-binding protein
VHSVRALDNARTFLVAMLLLFPFCVRPIIAQDRTVSVLYAGSLAAVMENGIGRAFTKSTGYGYQGEAQGSLGAAQMIHDHIRTPDVFISADPSVNVKILMGPQNRNLVKWFSIVAASQLVLAYNPKSKFASKFQECAAGTLPWYQLLATPGLRFGRGDPSIDPKGYRTLFLFRLASRFYHHPEIAALLGDAMNPAQVFPEIVLMTKIESGQFDAGIFYKHEVVAHKLPYVTLPPEVNQGDPQMANFYAQESYTTPSGQHVTGSPILFTVTILESARHREAALALVRFLLSSDALLKDFGFGPAEHKIGGDVSQVPSEVRALSHGVFNP